MHPWLKRSGIVLGGLMAIVLLALAGAYGFSGVRMAETYPVSIESFEIPTDSAAIARGRHVAVAIGKCVDCHGPDLGGAVVFDMPAFGRLVASNLTRGPGGIGEAYTDEDWVRAIRHGVGPDGKPLLFMPSQEYYYFNNADLGALIAYLKTLPAVNRNLGESTVGPMARVLYAARQLPLLPAELIDHDAPRPAPVPRGATREYGEYLAMTGGCIGCHGAGLSGGKIPGTPPDFPLATNLTPAGIGSWTEADFFRAIRTGTRPDGSTIDPVMPWGYTAQMSDQEIRALWLYLRSVPPRETGNR